MKQDEVDKLARWYCTLNSWEWPDDLPGKPEGWEEFPKIVVDKDSYAPNRYDWAGGIMDSIYERIGHKECLRWHHLHNLEKTNEEFETWWKKTRDAQWLG